MKRIILPSGCEAYRTLKIDMGLMLTREVGASLVAESIVGHGLRLRDTMGLRGGNSAYTVDTGVIQHSLKRPNLISKK
jgi:hypothetical protein